MMWSGISSRQCPLSSGMCWRLSRTRRLDSRRCRLEAAPHMQSAGDIASYILYMKDAITVVRTFVEYYQTLGKEAIAEELLASFFVDHTPFPASDPAAKMSKGCSQY